MSQQPTRTPEMSRRASAPRASRFALLIASLLITFSLTACSNTPSTPAAPSPQSPTPDNLQPATDDRQPLAPSPQPPAPSITATPSELPTIEPSITDVIATSTATPPVPLPAQTTQEPLTPSIKTVFLIVMENHNWSQIDNSPSAPYINKTLLPQASHAEQYYTPEGNHPSEPNYLWLEAGTSFGISNDASPSANHQSTTSHLVTMLDDNGILWKSYQEGISGKVCPLESSHLYAPKHNPMVFFEDVTGGLDANFHYCISHVRPYSELEGDLRSGSVGRYNFISPDLCHDMHNSSGCDTSDTIGNGDKWLSNEVPKILDSQAYKDGGALFITWDEGNGDSDGPIGMIVLSPYAKGNGYSNSVHYTHSSTLRTVQEIFGVTPFLRAAAGSNDLSDLFRVFP